MSGEENKLEKHGSIQLQHGSEVIVASLAGDRSSSVAASPDTVKNSQGNGSAIRGSFTPPSHSPTGNPATGIADACSISQSVQAPSEQVGIPNATEAASSSTQEAAITSQESATHPEASNKLQKKTQEGQQQHMYPPPAIHHPYPGAAPMYLPGYPPGVGPPWPVFYPGSYGAMGIPSAPPVSQSTTHRNRSSSDNTIDTEPRNGKALNQGKTPATTTPESTSAKTPARKPVPVPIQNPAMYPAYPLVPPSEGIVSHTFNEAQGHIFSLDLAKNGMDEHGVVFGHTWNKYKLPTWSVPAQTDKQIEKTRLKQTEEALGILHKSSMLKLCSDCGSKPKESRPLDCAQCKSTHCETLKRVTKDVPSGAGYTMVIGAVPASLASSHDGPYYWPHNLPGAQVAAPSLQYPPGQGMYPHYLASYSMHYNSLVGIPPHPYAAMPYPHPHPKLEPMDTSASSNSKSDNTDGGSQSMTPANKATRGSRASTPTLEKQVVLSESEVIAKGRVIAMVDGSNAKWITSSTPSASGVRANGKAKRKRGANGVRKCERIGCTKAAKGTTKFCIGHGGGRRCEHPECKKSARGSTRFCIGHGGGRRCKREGCDKGAEGATWFCKMHGGGRRCGFLGCGRSARGGTNHCITHGGGKRCHAVGCSKAAVGPTKFCIGHGGGKRCEFPTCSKAAQGATVYCKGHGGGKRCQSEGCGRSAEGSTKFCVAHGGGKRCVLDNCSRAAQGSSKFCKTHGARASKCSYKDCQKERSRDTPLCKTHLALQRAVDAGAILTASGTLVVPPKGYEVSNSPGSIATLQEQPMASTQKPSAHNETIRVTNNTDDTAL